MTVRQIAIAVAMLTASTAASAQTAASVADFVFSISNNAGFPSQQVGTLKIEQVGADTKWTLKADWNNSLNSGNPFVFGIDFALNPGTQISNTSLSLFDVVGQVRVRDFNSRGVFFNTANNTNRFTDGEAASWIFNNTTIAGFNIKDLHVNSIYNGGSVKFAPTSPVPEPETYAMMLAGLAGLGFMARRKKAVTLG